MRVPDFSPIILIHYHTMPHFDAPKIYSCEKHCEKRRNCLLQAISPFLTMFSTLYDTYFQLLMYFKMLSAIRFNLDQSKTLSSGNRSRHNSADSVPTSNLVCITEVAIRTTFCIVGIIFYTCNFVIDIQCTC